VREEVTGGWRKIHDVELYDLFSSPRIIREVTTNKIRWVTHVGEKKCL